MQIEQAARQLAGLGYPLSAAEKALAICGGDVSTAAAWLVSNPHVVEEERAREVEGRANSRVPSARYSGGVNSRDGRPPKAGEGSSSGSNLLSPLALPANASAAASTLRAAAARLSKVAEDIQSRGGVSERQSLVTPGSGWENEHWSLAMDAQLVLYACERAALRGVTPMLLKPHDLFSSEGEEDLSESVLARAPSGAPEISDREFQPGPATTAAATRQVSAESQLVLLSRRSRTALRDRFVVLKMLNRMAKPVLPLIDLRLVGDPASTAHRLATSKGPLFPETKAQLIDRGVALMHEDGDVPSVIVNRALAGKAGVKPGYKDGSSTVFGQLFAGLEKHSLRRTQAKGTGLVSWLVSFEGEGGTDHGGLFRESLHDACAELQSDALPLFIQCPNGRNNVGFNRDTWIPNPACTTWEHMRRYRFIGTLMGASMRTGSSMELDFSAFTWKQLIGEHPTVRDLAGVDERLVRILEFYRTHTDAKAWAQVRQTEGGVKYMVATSDSKTVELIPNGRATAVAFEDRERYCQLALNYRLHEVTLQIAAMREGFCRSGPGLLLPILTWRELERRICGRPEIDVKLLKKKTRYNMPGGEKNKVAVWFWNVMESLTNEDRVKFLSFAWGRGRLPPHSSSLEFTLQLDANRGDSHLPQSHTCFFTLDLPNYSSEAVLRVKLLYAVHNCKAIDTDFAASGRLGDDGDPEEDVLSVTDASRYDPSDDLDASELSRAPSDAAFEGAFDGEVLGFRGGEENGTNGFEEEEGGFDVEMEDGEMEEEELFADENFEEELDSETESDGGEESSAAQAESRYDEEVRRVTGNGS